MTTLVDRIRQCTQELEEVRADFDFKYGPWDSSTKLTPPFTSAMTAARTMLAQIEAEFQPPYRLAGYSSLGANVENLAPQWQHFNPGTQLQAKLVDCYQEFRRTVPAGRYQLFILSLFNGLTGEAATTFIDSGLFEDYIASKELYQDWQGLIYKMATISACIEDYQDLMRQGHTVHPCDEKPEPSSDSNYSEAERAFHASLLAGLKGAYLKDEDDSDS